MDTPKPTDARKPDLEALLAKEIEGEQLLWTSRPGPRATAAGCLFVLVAAVCVLLMLLLVLVLKRSHAFGTFPAASVSGAVAGWLLPSLTAVFREGRQTIYAITESRTLTIDAADGLSVRWFPLDKLGAPACNEREGGRGDLYFHQDRDSEGVPISIGFEDIVDVRGVWKLLCTQRERALSTAAANRARTETAAEPAVEPPTRRVLSVWSPLGKP
jgi:hypothetical protein